MHDAGDELAVNLSQYQRLAQVILAEPSEVGRVPRLERLLLRACVQMSARTVVARTGRQPPNEVARVWQDGDFRLHNPVRIVGPQSFSNPRWDGCRPG